MTRKPLNQTIRATICSLVVTLCCGAAWGSDSLKVSLKSERTATAISIGATLGPVALAIPFLLSDDPDKQGGAAFLAAFAIVFGPATGHQYADNGKKMAIALVLRGVLVLGPVALAMGSFEDGAFANVGFSSNTYGSPPYDRTGKAVAYVMSSLCVASMIYDMATAGRSVRAYNARLTNPQTRIYPYSIVGRQDVRAGIAMSF